MRIWLYKISSKSFRDEVNNLLSQIVERKKRREKIDYVDAALKRNSKMMRLTKAHSWETCLYPKIMSMIEKHLILEE